MFGLFDFLTGPASWPQPSWESIPDSETAEKLDWRSGGHILSRLFLVLSTKSCRCSFVKGLPSITKRKQEYCQFPWLKKKRNQNYLIWCYITPVYSTLTLNIKNIANMVWSRHSEWRDRTMFFLWYTLQILHKLNWQCKVSKTLRNLCLNFVRLGVQYPKNSKIFLWLLPQPSSGNALV